MDEQNGAIGGEHKLGQRCAGGPPIFGFHYTTPSENNFDEIYLDPEKFSIDEKEDNRIHSLDSARLQEIHEVGKAQPPADAALSEEEV